MYRAIGAPAVVLQAVPFAMAHLGKPELETMTTVLGGMGFGWIAWRTDSFLYPFLIHWGLNVFVRLVASS
jgi:membrane protease YdiL (CAAX protease family)